MLRDDFNSLGTRSLPERVRTMSSSRSPKSDIDMEIGGRRETLRVSNQEILPVMLSDESFFGYSDSETEDNYVFQNTLAIIKPEAVHLMYKIECIMEQNGFIIKTKDVVRLSREQAAEFYGEHAVEMYYPRLIDHMSGGPIVVYVLAKRDCIDEWRRLIGPAIVSYAKRYFPVSLRAIYGMDAGKVPVANAFHGSDTLAAAEREIQFFFPNSEIETMNETADDAVRYIQDKIMPTIAEGLSIMFEIDPRDRLRWFGNWLLTKRSSKN